MLELARIPVQRQRVVGDGLEKVLAAHGHHGKLPAGVVSAGKAVVTATRALAAPAGPSHFEVRQATATVVSGLHSILDGHVHTASDAVLPVDASARASHDAAQHLLDALFPHGAAFVNASSSDEWTELRSLRDALATPDALAALKTLHLEPVAARVTAHIARFGEELGVGGNPASASPDAPEDAWHGAYTAFAIQVAASVTDPATAAELTGGYTRELAAHRADNRAHRRASRAAAKAAPAATGTSAAAH